MHTCIEWYDTSVLTYLSRDYYLCEVSCEISIWYCETYNISNISYIKWRVRCFSRMLKIRMVCSKPRDLSKPEKILSFENSKYAPFWWFKIIDNKKYKINKWRIICNANKGRSICISSQMLSPLIFLYIKTIS